MSPLLAVALVCAVGLAPQDCTRVTALDVIVQPAATPMACALQAQATTAGAGVVEGGQRYLKITCERRKG